MSSHSIYYEDASEHLRSEGNSSDKKGSSNGTVKGNKESTGDVMSPKENSEHKNGGSNGTNKAAESPADHLAPNQPSDGQKSGSRIKVSK